MTHHLHELNIEEIHVGDSSSFRRVFTEDDICDFAFLTGDTNPLHTDEEYAKTTKFGRRIVHGMLVASLFSTLVGMYIPGKKCLYISQSISFKKPVHIGEELTVLGEVESISLSTRIIHIRVSITKHDVEVVSGVAVVQVL